MHAVYQVPATPTQGSAWCPCPAWPAPRSRPSIIRRHCGRWSLPRPPPSEIGVSAAHLSAAASPTSAQLLDAQKRIGRGSPSSVVTLPPHELLCTRAATRASPLGRPFPSSESAGCGACLSPSAPRDPNPRAAGPANLWPAPASCRGQRAAPLSLMPSLSHLAVCLIGMHCFAIPTSSSSRLLALRGGMQIESCRALGRTGVYSAALFVMTISLLLSLSFCTLLTSTPQSLLAISASRSLPLNLSLSLSASPPCTV